MTVHEQTGIRSEGLASFECRALHATNPLGYMAALGLLDVLTARFGSETIELSWTDDPFEPAAAFHGVDSLPDITNAVLADRDEWLKSPVLNGPNATNKLPDLKVAPKAVRGWIEEVQHRGSARELRLLQALVSEGAVDSSTGNKAKPTHFHFSAGSQQFLGMVRATASAVSAEHIEEGLLGPWTRSFHGASPLGWDATFAKRPYALRATNPSGSKAGAIVAADWLAFLSLRYFQTATDSEGRLLTTGCSPGWKKGSFHWPIWRGAITAEVAASLVAGPFGVGAPRFSDTEDFRQARGISSVYTCAIHRSDQGGYGNFGPPVPLGPVPPVGAGPRGRPGR